MDNNIVPQSLADCLFSETWTNVYAILDGASIPNLPHKLWMHEPQHECLFSGELEPSMAESAPYLVKLERDHAFTKMVCESGWGNHWGVFVIAPAEIEFFALRRHFRRFLLVLQPDGKRVFFRYYDPRVLRVYLPTCTAEESAFVFGPVCSFVLEAEDPSQMLRFSIDGENVRIEQTALSQLSNKSGERQLISVE